MEKITLKSNFDYMRFYLNNPIYDTNILQDYIKLRYLISLAKNEKELKKLDFNNNLIARFNNYTNKLIGEEIVSRLDKNDKSAYDIIKEETKRIDNETNKYQKGKLRLLPYEQMEFILTEYIPKEEIIDKLDNLYSFIPAIKKEKTAKILRLHK